MTIFDVFLTLLQRAVLTRKEKGREKRKLITDTQPRGGEDIKSHSLNVVDICVVPSSSAEHFFDVVSMSDKTGALNPCPQRFLVWLVFCLFCFVLGKGGLFRRQQATSPPPKN